MSKKKLIAATLAITTALVGVVNGLTPQVDAAAFTEWSIKPSRIEASVTDVNFLIKADAVTVATEDEVRVTFDTGYTVDATATNITTTTTDIALWDAECTTAWPGIGATASAVTGQIVDFVSGDLTVGQTYCFIITAGIDNPVTPGNYTVAVETRELSVQVDNNAMSLPVVDDDEIVINAAVSPYVFCDVETTNNDNDIDLGTLVFGTVTSSTEDIVISGATNSSEGMSFFYRNSDVNNGLFSATEAYTIEAPTAESTISATTTACAPGTPCYGIYHNGTSVSDGATLVIDTDFDGGTATTDAGPMTTAIYGEEIASTPGTETNISFEMNVNATAGQDTPVATDYTDTLIFTCKADV